MELFLNNTNINIPHLIRIAIAHYQFETIHPFLDGNGRIGRLLISLYLAHNKVLQRPLLYLSDFFEKNKTLYYDNLTFVRTKNDMSQWIKYFLEGVSQTAENSAQTLKKIIELKTDLEKNKLRSLGKRTKTANEFLYFLFHSPVITSTALQKKMKITAKPANSLIDAFIGLNILKERTGYSRNRIFVFDKYVELFM